MFQTIFGGGGSNEDGSANWWDIIRGGAGIAFEFLEGKKLFGMRCTRLHKWKCQYG